MTNKHMKQFQHHLCLGIQIKIPVRCHFPHTRMTIIRKQATTNVDKHVEKSESYTLLLKI